MFRIDNITLPENTVKIEWNIGKRCNLDCSYCPSEIHDNHSQHIDFSNFQTAFHRLSLIPRNKKFSFTGGEPTVHPKFAKIVELAKKQSSWVSVTTNGLRTYEYYQSLAADFLVFSVHYEDPKNRWQSIIETIVKLHTASNKKVLVHIMAHHDHMHAVRTTSKILDDADVPYTIRKIRWTSLTDRDCFDDRRYDANDLAWINNQTSSTLYHNIKIDNSTLSHSSTLIKEGINQFKGWDCYAGIESLFINWDGNVYRGTCRVGGSLGNIYQDKTINLTDVGIVKCTRDFCTCATDVPITKFNKE